MFPLSSRCIFIYLITYLISSLIMLQRHLRHLMFNTELSLFLHKPDLLPGISVSWMPQASFTGYLLPHHKNLCTFKFSCMEYSFFFSFLRQFLYVNYLPFSEKSFMFQKPRSAFYITFLFLGALIWIWCFHLLLALLLGKTLRIPLGS